MLRRRATKRSPASQVKLYIPKIFLFADRPSLLSADDFLNYPWADGAGNRQGLLD
jgi:hypothetical protein